MRYWWVNQNQTFKHEVRGGYLWSPKVKSDGTRNPYYETMREVAPGDLVFSFSEQRIRAVGIARSFAFEAPKPEEFGSAGRNWNKIGWRVEVPFTNVAKDFVPKLWIDKLRPLLPPKYSPLTKDGNGVQNMYLAELPRGLALVLADLIGTEVGSLARTEVVFDSSSTTAGSELIKWEEHIRDSIERDPGLDTTQKLALVLARRGQGLFKKNVHALESRCRVTLVDRISHLRASHCKPWRDSSNSERLDADNGLLLTPSIDHLFDGGFISFKGDGELLVSPVAHRESLERMGVSTSRLVNVGPFRSGQQRYLEYHRDEVFLKSRVARA
jgi:putative restriction endonuclease